MNHCTAPGGSRFRRASSALRPLRRTLAVGAVAALLVSQVGTGPVIRALGSISVPVVLAALALGALTTLAAAARWCVVARGVGLVLPVRRATAEVYRATFLNSVLPAGVLGDMHRAVAQGDGRGARVVVIERIAGQVVVVAVGVAVLVAVPDLLVSAVGGLVPAAAMLGGLVCVVAAAGTLVIAAGGSRTRRVRAVVVRTAASLVADVRVGLLSPRTGPGVVMLSVLAFGGYLALFVLSARVSGVVAPLPQLLPLLVLALLAMAVPLTVGGWGPREAVSTVAFGSVGLGAEQGLTVSVVYGVLSLVSCLPGAAVLLVQRRATRPESLDPSHATTSPSGRVPVGKR